MSKAEQQQDPETEKRPQSRQRRFRPLLALLRFDALVDTALHAFFKTIGRLIEGLQRLMMRFRVRGMARLAVEIVDEGLTFGAIGAVIALMLALPAFEVIASDWRNKQDISVTILDRNGEMLGRRGILLNDSVPLSEMPKNLINATLSTEDRRFYLHFGIDVMGTLRAIIANARADGVVQGGSSITQQLAKNLFLTNERTLDRKIKEAFLSLWLEANMSKDEILKLYLDRAYMGGGAFGVVAAAEFYFGKDVRDLTLAESAMLAGLYKSPTNFAPHVNLPAARARANDVLMNMVEAGFLTQGQILAALRNPATPVLRLTDEAPDFYLDWVFDEVKRLAPDGERVLTVKSTLDRNLQRVAETTIEQNLREYGQSMRVKQAATVVAEVDGAVRAMVGGRNYGASQFNRATNALRQPGSSFKPFVYATAMMNGYTPETFIVDAPITIGGWSPRNYGRSYAGRVTLLNALARSINTVPVRLAQAIGRDKIVELAHEMGLRSELKITRSLPLGAAEVTVLDMTASYAVFANGGYRADPYGVLEMRNSSGDLLYEHDRNPPSRRRVLTPEATANMNRMLEQVINAGTGRRARIPDVPAAGKTGTTTAYVDAWFVGYTADFVSAVWYGNDDNSATGRITGGSLPAMTWQSIISVAQQNIPARPLPGVDAPILPDDGRILAGDEQSAGSGAQISQLSAETRRVLQRIEERLGGQPTSRAGDMNSGKDMDSGKDMAASGNTMVSADEAAR